MQLHLPVQKVSSGRQHFIFLWASLALRATNASALVALQHQKSLR